MAEGKKLPWWTWVAPFFALYLATSFSHLLCRPDEVGFWCLPVAMAVVMVNWWGPRVLAGILCASIFFRLILAAGVEPGECLFVFCPGFWSGLFSWLLFRRLLKGNPCLPDLRNLIGFVLAGVVLPLILGGLVGGLAGYPGFGLSGFPVRIFHFWLPTATGVMALAVVPLVLMTRRMSAAGWCLPLPIDRGFPPNLSMPRGFMGWLELGGILTAVILLPEVMAFRWLLFGFIILLTVLRFGFRATLIVNACLVLVLVHWISASGLDASTTARYYSDLALLVFFSTLGGALLDTERHRRRLSEGKMSGLFEVLPDLVAVLDRDGRYLDLHIGYDDAVSRREERQSLGRTIFETGRVKNPGSLRKYFLQAFDGGGVVNFRYQRRRGDDWRWMEGRVKRLDTVVYDVPAVVCISRDITERVKAVEELKRSQESYSSLMADIPSLIAELDRDGVMCFHNPAMAACYGGGNGSLTGRSFWDFIPEVDKDEGRRMLMSLTPASDQFCRGLSVRGQDGSARFIRWTFRGIFDDDGRLKRIHCFGDDITGRRRVEEALKESDERFMDIIHTSKDAILLIDGETFVDCNSATVEMLGYSSRDEVLNAHPSELSPPCQPDGRKSFEKANDMMRAAFDRGFIRFEWIHRRADGTDFPVEVSLTPIAYQGKTILHCLWRDISEQKLAAKQLAESEAKYRVLFDESADGVAVADVESKRFTHANRKICELFGYSQEEFLRLAVEDVHPAEELPQVLDAFERQSRDIIRLVENLPCRRKDGTIFYADINTAPAAINGRLCNIGMFRDITERKRAEEALRESEQKFRSIVDNIGIGVSMISLDMRVIEINRQMRAWFPDVDIERQPVCYEVFNHPRRREVCEYCPTIKTIRDGKIHEAITPTPRGGEIRHYRVVSSPIFDSDGKLTAAIEMVEDISDRIKMENDLREAMNFQKTLLEAIPAPVFFKGIDGRYLGVNPAFEEFFGQSVDELMGKTAFDIVPEEMAREYRDRDTELFENPGAMQVYESKVLDNKGVKHDVIFNKAPFMDENGQVAGLIGVVLDITERKRFYGFLESLNEFKTEMIAPGVIDKKLARMAEWANQCFHSEACLIWGMEAGSEHLRLFTDSRRPDPEGHGLAEGFNCERVFRSSPSSGVIKKSLAEMPDDCELTKYGQALNTKHLLATRFYDSERKLLGLIVLLSRGEFNSLEELFSEHLGEIAANIVMAERDRIELIRETMARQVAEESSRAKTSFIANMSHELRTPLNAILGFAQILKNQVKDQHTMDLAKSIYRSGVHLMRLVSQVIDLSRAETIGLELKSEPFDLVRVIDDLRSMFSMWAARRGNKLLFVSDPDMPRVFSGDEIKLRQVLLNLIGNATKFTDNGEVRISFRHSNIEPGVVSLEVGVADNGVGISEEEQKRLFMPFSQASAGISEGGSGLGLALSKRLVEAMGGTLALSSETGKGTEVVFNIILNVVNDNRFRLGQPEAPTGHMVAEEGYMLEAMSDNETDEAVSLDWINDLPDDLKTRLIEAAVGLDTRAVHDIVNALPAEMNTARDTLRKMAGEFRFQLLINALGRRNDNGEPDE